MALRQCDKCSEMVDEAKAFCPGCGHAFVEEETRKMASNFDTMDSTVQLGQTMYNQMLSDMGLNTAKAPNPNPPEKRVEVLAPVAVPAKPPVKSPDKPQPSGNRKWLILTGVAVGFLLLAALAIVAGIFIYWSR